MAGRNMHPQKKGDTKKVKKECLCDSSLWGGEVNKATKVRKMYTKFTAKKMHITGGCEWGEVSMFS